MSNQAKASGQGGQAHLFEAALMTAAKCMQSLPVADLHTLYSQTAAEHLRNLRGSMARDPAGVDAYVREALPIVTADVYIMRLANGPTTRRHVRRLIEALPPASREQLFRELERDRMGVVTQPLFESAVRELTDALEEQERAWKAAMDKSTEIIGKLYKKKAGPKKNTARVTLLAFAKLLHTEKKVPYAEMLADVKREAARIKVRIENVEKLKEAIRRENKNNPLFPDAIAQLKAEFERAVATTTTAPGSATLP